MKRILVVDDDTGILESTKLILELEGYDVDTAQTATEGLEKIGKNFYHLGLFDIKLPDMEGTELLRRSQKIRPGMKKIMITGYVSLENSEISRNEGADAFILKPVDPFILIAKVKEKLDEQEKAMDGEKVAGFPEEKLPEIKRQIGS